MCVKHLIDCFANMTLLDNLEQSPLQVAMQKQHVDIVELLRASSHGPLYMRPHNGFPTDVVYPSAGHTQLSSFASSKKRKAKGSTSSSSAANGGHFPKFLPHQVSYPPSSAGMPPASAHLPGDSIAMADLQPTSSNAYAHHESPPTYPAMATHSPPLPPHCSSYPSTSTHGHYSVATPTTSGYSEVTPTTYDELPPSSVAHCNGSSLHMMENYPLYPPSTTDAGTHPLQHLPVVTEAETPYGVGAPITPDSNPYVQTPGAYSPPQSGGSMSHPSPHPSPNSGYGASPQSLTPSPESQQQQQQMISAVGTVHGTVHVEPGYSYPGHTMYPHHFIGSTPV